MSEKAMGVSSAAIGLREDSACSAEAVKAPEGFMGCGEPLSKTGDSSSACKGRIKDKHKEIFSTPRNVTVLEKLAAVKRGVMQESASLDAFSAVSMLNTQARKRSVSSNQETYFNQGGSTSPEARHHGSAGQCSAALARAAPLPHRVRPG